MASGLDVCDRERPGNIRKMDPFISFYFQDHIRATSEPHQNHNLGMRYLHCIH
jgi:hypothetical protein